MCIHLNLNLYTYIHTCIQESELLSLRLKQQNATQQYEQEHSQRLETVDKFGDLQRELGRLKEAHESSSLTMLEIKQENLLLKSQNSDLNQKIASLQDSLRASQDECKSLTAQTVSLTLQLETQASRQDSSNQADKQRLEAELARVKQQLSEQMEMRQSFDQYKAKAQSSLKKVSMCLALIYDIYHIIYIS